jgi:hypothetical protein
MTINSTNKFCIACGNSLLNTAVVCPKCGSPTPEYRPTTMQPGKSKTTAVVLAVFLGGWSWLYTYKVNAYKFWLTTIILVFAFINLVSVFITLQVKINNGTATIEDATPVSAASLIIGLLNFSFWLWALLEHAIKPQSFYTNYFSK